MNVQALLNPASGSNPPSQNSASQRPPPATQHYPASNVDTRRPKLVKDAPVFSEGNKIVGYVNYPPHEAGNDHDLEARHREFRVFPLGQILKKGVRHIPYGIDKKTDFGNKTGRKAFEVFQYTYNMPGEDKKYLVVWDYNIGLVRMTPFFKSCKYSKTIPAKALNQNPGMKDISYSITGGALVCQGYWVPWQAAREIAATFCWDIRWALTPVFGNDFPQMCRPPHNRSFANFVINPDTVRFCTAETARFKEEEASYRLLPPEARGSPVTASPMPVFVPPTWRQDVRPVDMESGYGTDVERALSTQVTPRYQYSSWSACVNGAWSPTSTPTTYSSAQCSPVVAFDPPPLSLPSPMINEPYSESFWAKRAHSKVAYSDSDCGIDRVHTPQDERQDPVQGSCQTGPHSPRAVEAARALMWMRCGGTR